MPDTAHPIQDIASALAKIVGDAHVITDAAERRVYSNDIFFWDDAETADVVVQPGSPEEVSALVLLIVATVTCVDLVSERVRHRFIGKENLR